MVIYSEMSTIMAIINWYIVGNDNGIHSYTVHNDIKWILGTVMIYNKTYGQPKKSNNIVWLIDIHDNWYLYNGNLQWD